jgi:hypothetical protein
MAVRLDGEHQARAHGFSVKEHGTGPTDAVFTSNVSARERELMADEIAQEQAWFNLFMISLAVHRKGDWE